MKRAFDIVIVLIALPFLIIPIVLVAIAVRLTSEGAILYWSERIGKDNARFSMPKFRTMRTDTPAMASHLMVDAARFVTPIGSLLRKSSLDELPQIWSIIRGDMSFVGPRPALFNQDDLVALRTRYGVEKVLPGLTGWAQVNGRDEIPIPDKVQLDREYLARRSFLFDLRILALTVLKVIGRDGITH
jgi:O-antigen biosynthesis protein WbqP